MGHMWPFTNPYRAALGLASIARVAHAATRCARHAGVREWRKHAAMQPLRRLLERFQAVVVAPAISIAGRSTWRRSIPLSTAW